MRILVVDDDRRLLAEVEGILKRNGHSADCAGSADDAAALVATNRYDFALVDYRMPGHDGAWFLKNAALPPQTKVLLVTSYVDKDVVREMFSAGIAGYISKPFDENELLTHLRFHSAAPAHGQHAIHKEARI